jgi:hypothetical protein
LSTTTFTIFKKDLARLRGWQHACHPRCEPAGFEPIEVRRHVLLDRSTVFQPFRRLAPQDVSGEGMGLAAVQMLVRRHGSDITYQSTLGEARFTFTLSHTRSQGVS